MSSSKRTKHLDIWYFFVKDQIKCGEVNVACCPTENMLADFFTKPLQGAAFEKCTDTYLIGPLITRLPEHTGVCWIKLIVMGLKAESKSNDMERE